MCVVPINIGQIHRVATRLPVWGSLGTSLSLINQEGEGTRLSVGLTKAQLTLVIT